MSPQYGTHPATWWPYSGFEIQSHMVLNYIPMNLYLRSMSHGRRKGTLGTTFCTLSVKLILKNFKFSKNSKKSKKFKKNLNCFSLKVYTFLTYFNIFLRLSNCFSTTFDNFWMLLTILLTTFKNLFVVNIGILALLTFFFIIIIFENLEFGYFGIFKSFKRGSIDDIRDLFYLLCLQFHVCFFCFGLTALTDSYFSVITLS